MCGEPYPFLRGADEKPFCPECRGIYSSGRIYGRRGRRN
ncbi:MAG: hypothetical protein KH828_09545 [Clostridiales bacterium]|nr:hypothetical protein [Clostridiales bacterium]